MKAAPRTGGFTLIEVLVALVVLAVGMLGIAILYVEGLRAGRTAVYRTTAITLASDMADRIRANSAAGIAYSGVGPGDDFGCVNGPADCSPEDMAADDWFSWLNDVRTRLPPGSDARIQVIPGATAGDATNYRIRIRWPEAGQPAPASFDLTVQQ